LITGAASGIGLEIARLFSQQHNKPPLFFLGVNYQYPPLVLKKFF